MDFQLNSRLDQDCHFLGRMADSQLLLLDNALFTWLILVPETEHEEIYLLPSEQKSRVYQQIDQLSEFIVDQFKVDKLNVAAIGNVVSQLHIHLVGRRKGDPCWPGVVWGYGERESYSNDLVADIRDRLMKRGLIDIKT